ncbi:hypothetical protein GCM10023093_05910 [Nemorincola caseinilytica]|uniref:Fibronectin type-III domain-containing protein n=2 Tax=Nemorincola caseinilytica TaxID=2054315 RepID=A0ABP8N7T1_9BACT
MFFTGMLLLCAIVRSNAQVATNYTFSAVNRTYSTALTGATTLFPSGWSAMVANVPLPFVFYFNGKGYSSVWVNSNGYITFGATAPLPSFANPISNNNGFDGSVSAFGFNNPGETAPLVDANNANPIIYGTQTSGSNTVFVIQWAGAWKQLGKPVVGGAENINFQIRLVQNTNVIEIMYGSCTSNITYGALFNLWSPVVGIGGASITDFNTRKKTVTAAWSTANTTAATSAADFVLFDGGGNSVPSGLTFLWTPTTTPGACSSTPAAPTAIASVGVACPTRPFAVSLAGLPAVTGLTFQWQSSATGLPNSFTNIPGATNPAYTSVPTASTHYSCRVSCGASTVSSTSVGVGYESACPTDPTYLYSVWYRTEYEGYQTRIGTIVLPPGINTCGSSISELSLSASGHSQGYITGTCANIIDLTYLPAIRMQVGTTYTGGTLTAAYANTVQGGVFIDFNDDGLFTGTGEQVSTITNFTNASSGNMTITIPSLVGGAYYGLHRMRIRSIWGATVTSADSYSGTAYGGNAKDFLVAIMPPDQTVAASPVAAPASICAPGAVETLTSTLNVAGGTVPGRTYTYTWTGPSGFGTSVSSSSNTTTFTPTSTAFSGVYSVIPVSSGARACNAGTVNVIVAASVSAPTNPPSSALAISGNTYQGATISFTPFATAPDGYLVVASPSSTAPSNPVDGTTYATGLTGTFGAGSIVVSGSVYGSAPPYSTAALSSNSRYYIYVYPFNIDCSGPKYYTGYPVLINNTLTTCIAPPTGLTATLPTGSTVDLSWTAAVSGGNPATVVAPGAYTYTVHAYLDAALTTEAIGYPVTGITGTSYVASGLGVGTTYYFVITSTAPGATCGSNSTSASSTTTCTGAAGVPLLQNFDNSTIASLSPNCWTGNAGQAGGSGGVYRNGGYFAAPMPPVSGLNYYLFNGSSYIAAATYPNQWLMSPGLSLTPGTYNVRFWYRTNSTWGGLKVQYTTNATLPTNLMADMTGATNIGTPLGSFTAGIWTLYSGSMTITTAGTYYVGINAILQSATLCLNMGIEDIEICRVPNVTVSNGTPPYCATATVNLSSAGSTGINQYSWAGPAGFTSTLANPVVSGLGVGSYTYSLTAVNDPTASGYGGYCSTGPITTSFTVNPGPDPITGTGTICPGETLTLSTTPMSGVWSSSTPAVGTVSTSGVVTGIAAGTTIISYTTSCGGSSTTVVTVNFPAGSILGNASVCQGLTQTLTGSIGGGTWTSSNTTVATIGTSSGIVSGLTTGTSNITYYMGSCRVSTQVTVVAPLPSITGTLSVCPTSTSTLGNTTGGGTWASSNSNATVGPSSSTVTGVAPGTSVITYTQGVCYTTTVMTIVPLPTASPTIDPNICLGGSTNLTANPSGSTNTYSWSGSGVVAPAAANTSASPASSTSYILTVSNSSITGCPTSTYTLAVTVDLPPVASPTNSGVICNGGTVSLTANPGGSTTNYLWSGPSLSSATAANPTATPTTNTTYTLTVTNGTTNSGCSNTFTTAVTVNATPTAAPTNNGYICNGGTVTLTANPAGGANTYTWSGTGLSSTTAANPTATPSSNAVYSLTVSNGTANPGCSPTTVYTTSVTVNSVPTAAPTNSGSICNGGTVTLNANPANGASAYSWSGAGLSSASAQSPAATPTSTTVYSLTVSDGSGKPGCSPATIYTTQVTVDPKPVAAPANNGYICNGGTVNLTANPSGGANTFTWSGSALSSTSVQNPTATPTTTSVYTITVSDGTGRPGCAPSTMYTTTVSVNATPTAAPANNGHICQGGTVNLSANPAGGSNTYTWSGSFLGSTTAQNPTANPTVTGTYSLVVSDGSTQPGCAPATVYTTQVTVNNVPTAVPTNSGSICNGGTVTLNANPANGATTYAWSGTGLSSGSAQNPTATPTSTTTYSLTVSDGSGHSGCSPATIYTTQVTVDPKPVAAPANNGYICNGGTVNLTANPSGGANTFTWSGSSLSSASVQNPTATPTATGIYSLTVSDGTARPGCAPATIYTTSVTVNAKPVAAPANDGYICNGGTVNLTANPSGGANTFTWSGSSLSSGAAQDPTATPTATGVYSLTVSDGSTQPGCAPATVYTTEVTVNAKPIAAPANSGSICNGGTVTLNANPAGGATTFTWSGPALSATGVQDPTATPNTTATYSLTVSDGSGRSGCSPATVYTTEVTVDPTPVAAPANNGYICEGGTVTLSANPSGGANTYVWSGTSLASTTASNPTATPVTTGVYSLTVSDGTTRPGCAPATVYTTEVTVHAAPTAAPTNDGPICAGGTVNIDANPANGASVYTWSGAGLASNTSASTTGTPASTRTYSLTVSDGSGKPGCAPATIYTTEVTVKPIPTLSDASNNGPVCEGATLQLNANSSANVTDYSWSGPVAITDAATAAATVPGSTTAATGVYTVTLNNGAGSGCQKTYTTSATVNTVPVVTGITPSTVDMCINAPLTLNASGASGSGTLISYNWTGPNSYTATTSSASAMLTPATTLASGSYSLSVTYSGDGCTSNGIASADVTVKDLPVIGSVTITPTLLCASDVLTLGGDGASGDGTLVSYNWSGPNSYSSTTAASTQTYTIPGAVANGSYSLTVTYTGTGCTSAAVASAVLTVNPAPNAGTVTGTAIVCEAATTTFAGSVSGGVWSSGTSSVATVGTSGIVSGVAAGTATISYSVTNMCGTAVATRIATVNPLPNAGTLSGTAALCPAVTATFTSTVAGGTWTSASTGIATVGSSSGMVTGVASGTTTISYATTNSCGTAYAMRDVTVSPTPVAGTLSGTYSVCPGATTTLSSTVAGGTWSSAATGTATVGSSTGVVTGVAAGTVSISYTVTSICGETATAANTVTVNASPDAGTLSGDSQVCQGTGTVLTSTVTGGTWNSSSTGVATVSSAGLVFGTAPGTSTISYSVSNVCGTDVATKVMTVNVVNIPSMTIDADPGTTVVSGSEVTFTAHVINAGTSPQYKWYVNSTLVPGATTNVYTTSSLVNGDEIMCTEQGTGLCDYSTFNKIKVQVTNAVVLVDVAAIDVRVTPNPSKGTFTVTSSLGVNTDEELTLDVTDMLGRTIYTSKTLAKAGKVSQQVTLDNALANGMFLLNVRTATGGGKVFHIIIER